MHNSPDTTISQLIYHLFSQNTNLIVSFGEIFFAFFGFNVFLRTIFHKMHHNEDRKSLGCTNGIGGFSGCELSAFIF